MDAVFQLVLLVVAMLLVFGSSHGKKEKSNGEK